MLQRLLGGLLAGLLMLGLTGCGVTDRLAEKAAEKAVEKATGVKVEDKGDTVTVTTKDGDQVTLSGQEGKLPEGFPLPLIKGATVGSGSKITTNNKVGFTAEITYTGTHKDTADFYEKALKDLGIKVERTDVTSDGETTVMLIGSSDKHDAWVMLNGKGDKGGTIAVMWGDK